MKKSIILGAAAIVALASCSKMTEDTAPLREIGFQVAKYMNTPTKATTGVVYSQSASFGSYAIWTGAEETNTNYQDKFMSNVQVSCVGTDTKAWKPVDTYYWPKTGSLDFVSVSPYKATPWIAPTITDHKFATLVAAEQTPAHKPETNAIVETVDLMYSDVALACTNNTNDIEDGTNSYTGVPTLFRHALAKLSFGVKLAYAEKTDGNGNKTTWVVKVKSLKTVKVKSTGSLTLTGFNATTGVWNLPTPAIWNTTEASEELPLISTETELSTSTTDLVADYFIVPQAISDDTTFEIVYDIYTYRQKAGETEPTLFIKEENITKKDIKLNVAKDSNKAAIANWEMAHNYIYTITIAPSKAIDKDGDGMEETPIEMTFDPATADWKPVYGLISITI